VETLDGLPFVLRKPMEPYSLVIRRIARELGNVLVGLALGTGAARGLAHIGVIRVLEREGLAVDLVAGSSMGSLIAAAWAVGKSADEMERIALQIKGKRAFLKLLDPVFPGSGIIRGMRVQNFLHTIVDELTFADTLIPLKIVASDLNTMEEVIFEQGKLIDAIRASISIPGVFRPVTSNGHTLIDGGITDPVPVHVLAKAGVTKIIAVNTIPNIEEMKQRQRYRSEISNNNNKRKPHDAMRETGPVVDTPTSIINVYMRSMHVMQSRMAEEACANADIVLRPMVQESVWYDFYHPERYIRAGEVAAEAALPQLKELVQR
jgi:NTE family protein